MSRARDCAPARVSARATGSHVQAVVALVIALEMEPEPELTLARRRNAGAARRRIEPDL
jgi:hypothetical protein